MNQEFNERVNSLSMRHKLVQDRAETQADIVLALQRLFETTVAIAEIDYKSDIPLGDVENLGVNMVEQTIEANVLFGMDPDFLRATFGLLDDEAARRRADKQAELAANAAVKASEAQFYRA